MNPDVKRELESRGYEFFGPEWSGGFADVAPARRNGVNVAVKVCREPIDESDPVQKELWSLNQIKALMPHQRLVTLHEIPPVAVNARRYLVTIWDLASGTLFDRLQTCLNAQQPGIPLDELLDRLEEAAEGLDYLHSKGFLHRDVTPKNIFLYGGDGKARLGDFGLAKLVGLSGTNSIVGTPGCMAPEVRRDGQSSRASDLYSLAATFVWLKTGHTAFENTQAQLAGTLNLSGIEAQHVPVVRAALSRDPQDRPNLSAVASVRAVRAGSLPGTAPTVGIDRPPSGDAGRAAAVPPTGPDRVALLNQLKRLMPQGLLDELMFLMNMPPEHQPPPTWIYSARCLAFIQWCESVDGALVRLEAELKDLRRR